MHPPTVEDLALELDELTKVIIDTINEFGISTRIPAAGVEALAVLLRQAHDHSAWQTANHNGYCATVLCSSACNVHAPGSLFYRAWQQGSEQAKEDTDVS